MAERWGWTGIIAVGSHKGEIDPWPESFETKALAQEHLQDYLDMDSVVNPTAAIAAALVRQASQSGSSLVVTCPPTLAWIVYRIPDGVSTGQAASFFVMDHEEELWQRLRETRRNSAVDLIGSGCVVVALCTLSVASAIAAAWARGKWGA